MITVVVKTKTLESKDPRPENEGPFMILIQELRLRHYGFTDEKQLKAWHFSARNVIIRQLKKVKSPTITLNTKPEIALFPIIFLFRAFLIYFRKH